MKRTKHRMRFFNSDSLPASTRLSSDLLGASRRNTCLGPFDSSFSVRCAFEPTRVSQPTGSAPLVRVCDRVALCHRCAACQSKTGEDVSWSFKRTSDTATKQGKQGLRRRGNEKTRRQYRIHCLPASNMTYCSASAPLHTFLDQTVLFTWASFRRRAPECNVSSASISIFHTRSRR
ncbi:hypothetical protein M440DRAFT_247176 [Trichoderma longibrachiatum ATCC 18648]|uniref:Uncharacterized protein n=1 Tax=Trichoderma longibrachiatum ATCC 18648 TaxID=983965 RepID=A0A2T4CDX5_TRILO|nr:hypothetical protein M440DRAFT_247176 [Trichoderma longibrachiatum ATCC 18648]